MRIPISRLVKELNLEAYQLRNGRNGAGLARW